MSAQTMDDVFAPILASYRAEVMKHTWGHLAPKKNQTYYGSITFAIGVFGDDELNPTALSCEFKTVEGLELESSPWFYDYMADFLSSFASENRERAGHVYRFEGKFRNYEFRGIIRHLKLVE